MATYKEYREAVKNCWNNSKFFQSMYQALPNWPKGAIDDMFFLEERSGFTESMVPAVIKINKPGYSGFKPNFLEGNPLKYNWSFNGTKFVERT